MQWREDVCSYKSSQTVPVCASELPQLLCLTEGVIWMNIRLFCGWFWAAPVCLYINFSIRWWGATWWCYMTITSDPRLNLKTIASVCNSTAANPTPDCFDELYCFVGLFLLFAWFSCETLSNCSCCIWGGSVSSRTQTGCKVLCLFGFLCDWPQCLVFRHRLSSHSEGGAWGRKTRRGSLHVHHMLWSSD